MVIKIILIVVITLIAGLIILYLLSKKINTEKIIEIMSKINSLGTLPLNENNSKLMIENNPKANMIQYIKDIRSNISKRIEDNKTILITSYNFGEGKSFIANNLAVSFARINKKVLLIDANLREESNTSDIFYIEDGEGLTDYARDIVFNEKIDNLYKAKRYIKETQIPNLHVLQNGTLINNPTELIMSSRIKEIIEILKKIYDVIILDGPSFENKTDVISWSTVVDKTILTIEKGKTRIKQINEIKDAIEDNNGEILGFILNKTNLKQGKHYGKQYNENNYGVYIEKTKNRENVESLNYIIDKIAEDMQEKSSSKYSTLYNEMKDNILIEDFINDIEVNFNTRLDNIEKNSKLQLETLLKEMTEKEKNINDIITIGEYKQKEQYRIYEEFSNKLIFELKNLSEEIKDLKIKQEEIFEKNIEYINQKFNEVNTEKYLQEILEQMKNLNYDVQFKQIVEEIKKLDYKEQIEEIRNQVENLNYDEKFDSLDKQIESLNYDEKIDELKEQVNNINYDEQFEEINNKIEMIENRDIEEKEYNKDIEEKDENKELKENKKNNIINLRQFFMEARKNNKRVFSIEETINYEDLERLSAYVIDLDAM